MNSPTFVPEIGDCTDLQLAIQTMLREEQDAGTIPPERQGPGREEMAFVFGSAARPFAVATFFPVHNGAMWLDLLIVHRDARRRGYGRALLEAVRVKAATMGCDKVELSTMTGNVAMQRLAGSLGLAPIGLLYRVPADGAAPPDAGAISHAESAIAAMAAEQQSQGHALRLRLRRARKAEHHG